MPEEHAGGGDSKQKTLAEHYSALDLMQPQFSDYENEYEK